MEYLKMGPLAVYRFNNVRLKKMFSNDNKLKAIRNSTDLNSPLQPGSLDSRIQQSNIFKNTLKNFLGKKNMQT